jgi:hypothetical protein
MENSGNPGIFDSTQKLRWNIQETLYVIPSIVYTLQRQNAENLKQIFPEKRYRGLSPNFHIRVSVNELYIPTMGLPVLLGEICRLILGIYK